MDKSQFLSRIRRKEKRVDLGDVEVVVKQLLVVDQNTHREFRENDANPLRVNASLLALSLFSPETGERIFSDADLDDVHAMPCEIFQRLLDEVTEINGWKEADPVKNS